MSESGGKQSLSATSLGREVGYTSWCSALGDAFRQEGELAVTRPREMNAWVSTGRRNVQMPLIG